jgi:hypothetical protein
MDESAIRKQSESAYNQWAAQWREHAKIHSKYAQKSWRDFENIGIGKAVLCAANGASLELEMPTIQAKAKNVDIMACDKSLGHLIRAGVRPTYVLVCDANVDYEKYLKPYEKELQDTVLFINVCANPLWSANGNWKDIYFFTNQDILGSEKEFNQISGCVNTMPAGTNVSNAMIVLLTQSDNTGRRNYFGYDKILLVGYDYSWTPLGSYYAYDKDGGGKHSYMRHVYTRNIAGDYAFTSSNLAFSAMWLNKYVDAFRLPVIQCSKQSVFLTRTLGVLSEQMDYAFRREDSDRVREMTARLHAIQSEKHTLLGTLRQIATDHHFAVVRSV